MDASQYFYRNVMFSKQGNEISLVDIYNPKNEEKVLEMWFGLVLQLADGQHTVNELLDFISKQYKGDAPDSLGPTIHSVVERLVNLRFIVLTKEATELPYYLSRPVELLDIEKAKKLMEEDKRNTKHKQ